MRFAGIHVIFMLKLVIAAHDRRILVPNDALQALHELAKYFETGFRWQGEWSCSIFSMCSDRLTKCHRADAFDGR